MFKPWGSGTLCSNPGFWNSMFEPWVRELYVRTRGLENSMFEPRVRELLPPPPESSTPGFGNSMFEPGVWGTLCWNPGFWFSPSFQGVRTLGSGTVCSNPEGTLCWNPGVWNSSPPPRKFQPWVRELHVPSNFKEKLSRGHAPSSFGEGGLEKGGPRCF